MKNRTQSILEAGSEMPSSALVGGSDSARIAEVLRIARISISIHDRIQELHDLAISSDPEIATVAAAALDSLMQSLAGVDFGK